MNLSLLNVDVLSHLIEFVKPVDRFNLVLSGILKGFENVKGIDLSKRYSEHLTLVSNDNQIVICSESIILELNLGCVEVARAN